MTPTTADASEQLPQFRCGLAARWLPRAMAAAILVTAMLASWRIDERVSQTVWGYARHAVVLAGALAALGLLRQGGEVRVDVRLEEGRLEFVHGARATSLRLADIDSLRYAPPFSVTRHWLPATVLLDRWGKVWRLSALLVDGGELIRGLLERAARNDLSSWAEVHRLEARMGRAGQRVVIGYAVAAALILAAGLFYFGAPA